MHWSAWPSASRWPRGPGRQLGREQTGRPEHEAREKGEGRSGEQGRHVSWVLRRGVSEHASAYNDNMTAAATLPSPFKIVHTVCSHDCPDSCGVLVTVNAEGRAIKIAGDPSHPVTQGFLCGKVAKYLDRVYAPDRILYPLKRRPGVAKGPLTRGEERHAFERVSWDEALEAIAARLKSTAG